MYFKTCFKPRTEKAIEEIMRPNSPNTLIENSKNGEDAIKNDWEQKKLKKRVDANEEGVDRALAILDKLVHEIQDVKKDLDETKKHIGRFSNYHHY